MLRALWDDDLDIWVVMDERAVIVARGMPDRHTAEDLADAMNAAVSLDDTIAA